MEITEENSLGANNGKSVCEELIMKNEYVKNWPSQEDTNSQPPSSTVSYEDKDDVQKGFINFVLCLFVVLCLCVRFRYSKYEISLRLLCSNSLENSVNFQIF